MNESKVGKVNMITGQSLLFVEAHYMALDILSHVNSQLRNGWNQLEDIKMIALIHTLHFMLY